MLLSSLVTFCSSSWDVRTCTHTEQLCSHTRALSILLRGLSLNMPRRGVGGGTNTVRSLGQIGPHDGYFTLTCRLICPGNQHEGFSDYHTLNRLKVVVEETKSTLIAMVGGCAG